MTRAPSNLAIAAALLGGAATAPARQEVQTWTDPVDAVIRRTDSGNNGPILPQTVLPDVVATSLTGWQPFNACADPYTGIAIGAGAHFLRLDVVFKGLVNPPGTLGLGGQPFDPFRFGPSPLYGFLDVDVDNDVNTGGEFFPQATFRYLGNVARFGRVPTGPLGPRAAVNNCERDNACQTGRPYERSGADWALTFCGCYPVTIKSEIGNGNGIFEPGEVWRTTGRFFQRVGAYTCSSGMSGGSGLFTYDPVVEVRFLHSAGLNQTTITLVYGLDMVGAAALACDPVVQPINFFASDHTSIAEGLSDIIFVAPSTPAGSCCRAMVEGWIGNSPGDFLDPAAWGLRGIFGTSYSQPEDAPYVWTDTCFADAQGDLTGDGLVNTADRVKILQQIASLDGTPCFLGCRDADGVVNGSVTICDFGTNFDLHDVTGDGVIGALDLSFICPADFNGDGFLTAADFGAFQTAFLLGDPRCDFTHDGFLTVADLGAFQTAFTMGCP